MAEQLNLFDDSPVKPCQALLNDIEAMYEPVNELWNRAIAGRETAPPGRKSELRKLASQMEEILMILENVADCYK